MTDEIASSLFGRTRRNILALLFGRPDETFYLRQVARETGAGVGAVQRELAGLTKAGLITRTPRGKQVFFQADRSSPVFSEIKSLMEKTTGLADVVRSALAELDARGLVSFAFLYGSVATGTHGPSSDVDLMIIGDTKLLELIPAVREAQDRLGREINPTVYPVAELQDRLKARDHFISRVLERPKIMLIGTENELEKLAGESLAR
jgi:predicted nucleotidyltransferase